jgi:hypothetical protein
MGYGLREVLTYIVFVRFICILRDKRTTDPKTPWTMSISMIGLWFLILKLCVYFYRDLYSESQEN